ncbi:hypothetical protein Hesp01_38440 [Herbidospora sp. NBRC 101105]|nr:hypothetical protein Hesp01_38440 [Herbidospora sp. NBRC 101105]
MRRSSRHRPRFVPESVTLLHTSVRSVRRLIAKPRIKFGKSVLIAFVVADADVP